MPERRHDGYRIEPMSLADFDAVLRLWRDTAGMGLTDSDTREQTAQYLERNPGLSLVARHEKEIVATILCGHDGRRGYLYHLAVAAKHRRNGLGKKLVQLCLARLEELGILKCNAYVFAENADGEAFWLRHGWELRPNVKLLQKPLKSAGRDRCC